MKKNYTIREISKEQALEMIMLYHYSNTLSKLNKYFLGFYLESELVGVVTLGWGTRPRHTIQKLFPNMTTAEYLEIGRMCMTEDMPRNSESQMLSQCVKWLKRNHPEIKILFTWADGMLGKVGYVYQASNFIYTGKVGGEMYIQDGVKIHVRKMKAILTPKGTKDKRLTLRPTLDQMRDLNINHYKGSQYRYIYFLCDKKEKKRLQDECLVNLTLPRPKDNDLEWRVKDIDSGKWIECNKPPYKTDFGKSSNNEPVKCEMKQMSIFEWMEANS